MITSKQYEGMFSSKSDEWETPQKMFNDLNKEFGFDLDPCANESNHKCEKYFTREQDGLLQDWGGPAYSAIPHTAKNCRNGL